MPERPPFDPFAAAAIAAGSALGGWARVSLAVALADTPWLATAIVNVAGALLMGWLHAVSLPGGRLPLAVRSRQFLLAGCLGGFTTFSILSAETLAMLMAGAVGTAAANMLGSLALALAAVALGFRLGGGRT